LRSRSHRLLRSVRGLGRYVLIARLPLLVSAAATAASASAAAAAAAAAAATTATTAVRALPQRPCGPQSSWAGGGDFTLARLRTPQSVRVAQQLLHVAHVGCNNMWNVTMCM
jgi:hypothetical protein